MDRPGPEVSGNRHDEHEATGNTKENWLQTKHRHNQSMRDELPPSETPNILKRSVKVFFPKVGTQTPCSSDGGQKYFWRLKKMFSRQKNRESLSESDDDDVSGLTLPRNTNLRMPWEGVGGNHADEAVHQDPETDQVQAYEPGSADQSGIVDFHGSGRGNVNDFDFDLPNPAQKTNSGDPSGWCSVCLDLEQWMMSKRHPGVATDFALGTFQDLQSRAGCPSCDDMLDLASKFKLGPDKQLKFEKTGPKWLIPYLFNLGDKIFLAPSKRMEGSNSIAAVVDPDWFKVATLKEWLAVCDEKHGEGCHMRHGIASIRPRFLIDVRQGCLVDSHGDERYFALSYVWGSQHGAGMATKANIKSLKRQGTIRIRNPTFRLPRTVENAIQLTDRLGERFLWVDRLCIIQDDLDNWHSQIKKMGSIYANAYCTFVASDGADADHGIPGLNQHSGPRHLLRRRIKFPSVQMIEVGHVAPTLDSTWIKRGWTFQELKLSRRVVFFGNDIRWTCQQARWQEDIVLEPESIATTVKSQRKVELSLLSVEPWPDLVQWFTLIYAYCLRTFRFEEDAGAAFAGIEEILSHSFPGGFCFGLPEFYFDIALLWWPRYPQQRRTSKSDRSPYLPSWSFLGWKGSPRPDALFFACDWIATGPNIGRAPRTSSTVPKVEWIQKGPCGQERRIKNDYHVWKRSQEQTSPAAHAKLGWRREGNENDWTHASIPGVSFRYPVPFGFQPLTDEYHAWPASLRLRSESTFLIISNVALVSSHSPNECLPVEMVTLTGKWAGILHLNTDEAKNVPFGEKCELVALSCGSVSNKDGTVNGHLEEWLLKGRPKASEKYEFYNVMWIRREGTYVLREAIGRVEKSVWDSQDLQNIDVELR